MREQCVPGRPLNIAGLGTRLVTKHAVASARDQALAWVSPCRMDHGEHIFVWSLRITASSCRIAILRLPDNYNRRTGLQVSVGGARMHCMHAWMRRRAGMYHITNIFSYKFKIVLSNNKEKPSATGKLNQWWKPWQRWLSTCMILNFTSLKMKKGHKQESKKDFYLNQKDVGLWNLPLVNNVI